MNLIGGLFAWFGFVRDLFVLGLMRLLWAVIAVGLVFVVGVLDVLSGYIWVCCL